MFSWMLELPPYGLYSISEAAFEAALATRDAQALPASLPRWVFLEWLARQGYMLQGPNQGDIISFEPRIPNDRSPDDFSKRTAVFASFDGVWAMMYALATRPRIRAMLNMALQVQQPEGWAEMGYFLSLAPRDPSVTAGRELLQPGSVYVPPAHGFERMPSYAWPGLGTVLESHWANPEPVRPLIRVPVSPDDFPLPVQVYDAKRVDALAQDDPWGFPWLEPCALANKNAGLMDSPAFLVVAV